MMSTEHPNGNTELPQLSINSNYADTKQGIRITRSDPLATSSSQDSQHRRAKCSSQHHQPHSKERRARWLRDKLFDNKKQRTGNGCGDKGYPEGRVNSKKHNQSSFVSSGMSDSGFQDSSHARASQQMSKYLSDERDDYHQEERWYMNKDEKPNGFREQRSWNENRRESGELTKQRLRAGLSLPVDSTSIFPSIGVGDKRQSRHLPQFWRDSNGVDTLEDDDDPEEEDEEGDRNKGVSHSYLSRQTRLPYPYCLKSHNSTTHHGGIPPRSRSQSPCSITSESAESQAENALDPPRLSKSGGVGVPSGGTGSCGDGGGGLTLGVGGGVIGGGYGINGRKLSVLFSSYDAWNEEHIVQGFKELNPTATSVFEAAWTGNLRVLEEILKDDDNLAKLSKDEFRDNEGRTPLHLASACGHIPCVHLLLAKGAEVNSCDSNEKATPLSCAASCGSLAVIQVLLEHGANVNSGYEHGKTALHWAIQAGSVDCARKLLEAGALQNPPQVYSETPLHIAAALGDPDCLQLLLDFGADVNLCKGTNRSTALHLSAEEGNAACVRLLLKAGASHTAKDIRGHTALHVAATCDADCVSTLLHAGADPNAVDANGRTPLHCAVARGSRAAECVRLLVESRADIDAQDNYGYTPLHLSAVNESSQCASILLYHGSDVTLKTNAGTTALSLLVRRIPDVMRYIVERLDSAVTIHDHDVGDPDCEIRLDFRAIVPNCEKRLNGKGNKKNTPSSGKTIKSQDYFQKPRKETEFLTCLVAAGNKKILAHPLSEAFLTLKWRRVRKFFWASLLFQIALVALFTSYVVEVYLKRCPYTRSDFNSTEDGDFEGPTDPTTAKPTTNPYIHITNPSTTPPVPPAPPVPRNTHPKFNLASTNRSLVKRNVPDFSWIGFVPRTRRPNTRRPQKSTIAPSVISDPITKPTTRGNQGRGGIIIPVPEATAPPSNEISDREGRMDVVYCELTPYLEINWLLLVVFTSLMAIKEIFQLVQSPLAYVVSSENLGQWLLISSVSITVWSTPELQLEPWQYPATAVGIFLAWTLMLLQVGRFPALGLYVQMLGKVAANFGIFILAYACLLVAFALAFCVLFPEHPPYGTVALSILKVFTMMVGEVDYEDLFYSKTRLKDDLIFHVTAHVLYGAFVVFVTIVLMNLLVGLAVHDIQGLQKGAKLNRLSRQTALISRLESFIFSKRLQAVLPNSLGSILQKSALLVPSSYNWSYYFRPNDARDKRLPKDIKQASLRLAAARHSHSSSKSKGQSYYHPRSHNDNPPAASTPTALRPLSSVSHHHSALAHNPDVTVQLIEQRLDQLQNQMVVVNGRIESILRLLMESRATKHTGEHSEDDSVFFNAATPVPSTTPSSVPPKKISFCSTPPVILNDITLKNVEKNLHNI